MTAKTDPPAEPTEPDMPGEPDEPDGMYEETDNIPQGRKTRQIPASLLVKLEESAKRQVAFARTSDPDTIDQLRRDLNSKTIKAKWDIATQTAKLENGQHRLTFSATAKVEQ